MDIFLSGKVLGIIEVIKSKNNKKLHVFCAINKQKVDVKITALTEALTDVTVEVKDNNGNIVEVKPVAVLDVGETVATFTFKTALTANPVGEWTVNGVKFDADAQAAVAKVNAANNQVNLLSALKSTYFKNVTDAKIIDYFTEMNGKTYDTVAEVQKAIDKANEAVNSKKLILDITEAMTANNEVTLLSLLGDVSFDRVNANLITKYMAEFKGNVSTATTITTSSTIDNVQAEIDAVNLKAAQDAVTAADTTPVTALTSEAIADAQALVSALPEKEVAEKTTKKGLQDRLDKANAVAKVKNATTQASLLSALKSPVLKLQNIDDALAKFYKAELVPTNITNANYSVQTLIVDAGKTAAIADYNTKIEAIKIDTPLENVKALLTELKRLDGTNFTEKINDALLEDYRTALVAGTITTTASVNTIIQTINTNTAELKAVEDFVGTDANALLLVLQNKKLALKNVVVDNKDAYFADKALIIAEATSPKTVADLQKAINTINFVVDANAASTTAQMQKAITGIAVNEEIDNAAYVKLSSAAKAEVADLVLAARSEETGKVFADVAAISQIIEDQTKGYTAFLTSVNGATNINDMMIKLDDPAFKAYQDLGTVEKVEKAELVYNALVALRADDKAPVVSNFNTLAQIKTAAGL